MRIISGEKRGAKLLAPKGSNTRPTRDRVKESLFNILLNHEFSNSFRHKVVIDAFAGSGALGLEALSRGAAHAIFIENDIAAIKTLKKNRQFRLSTTIKNNKDGCQQNNDQFN